MKKLAVVVVVFGAIGVVAVARICGGKNISAAPSPVIPERSEAVNSAVPSPAAATAPIVPPANQTDAPLAARARPRMTNSLAEVTFKVDKVEPIPGNLLVILGQNEKKDYFTRIKTVHKLAKNLSQPEINTLYLFLNRKNNEDSLKPEEFDALKNEVSMAIMGQEKKPLNYANNLMAMYADIAHDVVWRDYLLCAALLS
ncbi:MAG: hypothetical protein WCN95_07335 [bacterium]